jgi:Family of unknown function (DUF6011)
MIREERVTETPQRYATDRQITYIRDLAKTAIFADTEDDDGFTARDRLEIKIIDGLSRSEASETIDWLRRHQDPQAVKPQASQQPQYRRPQYIGGNRSTPRAPAPVVTPGVFSKGGEIYVVVQNRAKTRTYAKHLVPSAPRMTESGVTVSFDLIYAPGIIRDINESDRMSVQDARPYMIKYGRCLACARKLKAATSVERGIGPVCIKMFRP